MNDTVANPLAPPVPDFTAPDGMEISQEARDFASAPMFAGLDKTRPPTNEEIVQRLAQARDLIGDRFWQAKAPPPPTAAERAEADRLRAMNIKTDAAATDFAVRLPENTPPETGDRIKGTLASLQLSGPVGNHIAERIVHVGQHIGRLSEADQQAWQIKQQTMVAEWAMRHGWDLAAKTADVEALLKGKDAAVSSLAMSDGETFIRLALHADHLRTVKR